MSTKLLLATCLSATIASSLFSQTPVVLHTSQSAELELVSVVQLLEQNGLLALLSAVILMGGLWVCYVVKACTLSNKPQKDARIRAFTMLAVLMAGLGSCAMEQQAMASQHCAVEAREHCSCPYLQHVRNGANPGYNHQNIYNGYSNWYGPPVCVYCGKRIYQR